MASIEELFADLRESYDRRHDRLVECLSLLTRMEEYSRRKEEYSTVTITEVDAMPDAQLHPVAVQEAQLHPVAVPSTQIHHDVVSPPTTMEEVLTAVPETQLHLVAVPDAQLQPVAVPDVLLHPDAFPGAQIDYGVKPLRRGATITTGCSFGKSASGYTAAAPQIHFIGDHNPELQRDCTWWQDLGVSLIALADDTRRHWKVPWRWFDESMFDCCDYIGAWRPPWPPPAVEQPGLSDYTILVAVPGTELHLVVHDHVSDVLLGVDVELSGINTHAPANCSMQCHTGLLQQTHVKGVDHKEHTKEHAAMCACDCTRVWRPPWPPPMVEQLDLVYYNFPIGMEVKFHTICERSMTAWPAVPVSAREASLGCQLVQVGVGDVFVVHVDFNFNMLDHLIIAEPRLRIVGSCNEIDAEYAADEYARMRRMGACASTFVTVGEPNSDNYGTNRIGLFGKDPFVVSRYAVNFARGVQDISGHVACCKHYVSDDLDDWHNLTGFTFNARVTERDMAESFLRPCVMRVRDANSAMCSYNRDKHRQHQVVMTNRVVAHRQHWRRVCEPGPQQGQPLVHIGACLATVQNQSDAPPLEVAALPQQRPARPRHLGLVVRGVRGVLFVLEEVTMEWRRALLWRTFFSTATVVVVLPGFITVCQNGRCDFTWVQALGVSFGDHLLYVAVREAIDVNTVKNVRWVSKALPGLYVTCMDVVTIAIVELDGVFSSSAIVVPLTKSDATMDAVEAVAKTANAHGFDALLYNGYKKLKLLLARMGI